MTPSECEDFDNLHTQNLHRELVEAREELKALRARIEKLIGEFERHDFLKRSDNTDLGNMMWCAVEDMFARRLREVMGDGK